MVKIFDQKCAVYLHKCAVYLHKNLQFKIKTQLNSNYARNLQLFIIYNEISEQIIDNIYTIYKVNSVKEIQTGWIYNSEIDKNVIEQVEQFELINV